MGQGGHGYGTGEVTFMHGAFASPRSRLWDKGQVT